MDKQALFNKVVTHLLAQNQRSSSDSHSCAYRGNNGLMCAAGAVLPDEHYKPSLEGKTLSAGPVCEAFLAAGVFDASEVSCDKPDPEDQEHTYALGGKALMLLDLQSIHGNTEPCFWFGELTMFAGANNLTMPTLEPRP